MPLAIAVHGGAGDIPESLRPDHAAGIQAALRAGKAVLQAGGTALEAAIAAVIVLEDLPAFNAGYGSVLNREGFVQMDAGLMDGTSLDVGAVGAIEGIKNPILAAQAVLKTPHILFAKADAEAVARAAGVEFVDNASLITPRRHAQWASGDRDFKVDSGSTDAETIADTVGAVALDGLGNIAAATSTGGMSGKPLGRIGDSPIPGGGFYADSHAGGCSTTGWGETIARVLLARRAIENLERGMDVQAAAEAAVAVLGQRIEGGEGGLILVASNGQIGAAFNSQRMTHAYWNNIDDQEQIIA
ncbi:isoaspartyl peptidase/L-asparaginase family protein [Herpetosiphon sp. NSE202]|uniref:isoaspartyl peptidase/L-asparaginase family protein n=1 Tax=Herpetosiphon sp. NSE202 TaxID=3351349 RepID=UPI0036272DD9